MRHLTLEAWLTKNGYTWTYEEHVPLTRFDPRSVKNPARLTRHLIDDRVQDYALAMESGDAFPAVVALSQAGSDLLLIATGCHRVAAKELSGGTEFDAYVVDEGDGFRREELMRELNGLEGFGDDRDTKLAHIVEMHRKHKVPLRDLARDFKVPESSAQKAHRALLTEERAVRVGVDLGNTTASTKDKLQSIRNDRVFREVALLVKEASLPTPNVEKLLRELNEAAAGGEAAELSVIQAWRAKPEVRARLRNAKAGDRKRAAQLTFFTRGERLREYLAAHPSAAQMHLTDPDGAKAANILIQDLVRRLKAAQETLPKTALRSA